MPDANTNRVTPSYSVLFPSYNSKLTLEYTYALPFLWMDIEACNVYDFRHVLFIYFQNSNMENEQTNCWRFTRIMFNDVQQKLRDLLKTKFRERYKIAWGDNRTTGEFFKANANIEGRYQSTITNGHSAQFDFTALFKCLLFSDAGILLPKFRKIEERTQPITDSERVDELRVMRNDMAHALSSNLPKPAFDMKLMALKNIYKQLQWNPDEMRQMAVDPVTDEEITRLQLQLEVEREKMRALEGMSSYLFKKKHLNGT